MKVSIPTDLPEGVSLLKDGTFKLPKTAAEKADLLYRTRELRLDIERRTEKLSKLESLLKEWFIENLPKSNATGISGKLANAKIQIKPVPIIEDYDRLYEHIKKTGEFDLLQKRLNEGAVKERIENGESVPGVGILQAKKVSVTKI